MRDNPWGGDKKGTTIMVTDKEIERLIKEVPDTDNTRLINYWRRVNDEVIYLEGWCDKCLMGTGFPPMERGETASKITYIEDLTPGILEMKAKAKENPWGIELKLVKGEFVELEDANYLYGVTYGVYERAEKGIKWPEPLW